MGSAFTSASTFAAFSASSLALIRAKIAGSSTTAFPANVRGASSFFFDVFALGSVVFAGATVFSVAGAVVSDFTRAMIFSASASVTELE